MNARNGSAGNGNYVPDPPAKAPADDSPITTAPPTPPALNITPLDVVWQSPVQTGTGWGMAMRQVASAAPIIQQPIAPNFASRHVVAFESDLFDNSFVHWEDELPTLEMIAGYKPSDPGHKAVPVESLMSSAAGLTETAPYSHITPMSATDAAADGTRPFDPDTSQGSIGPAAVRKDGIEDPRRGWRPTGLVFFETLTTPPRGIVYSSRMLDAFGEPAPAPDQGQPLAAPAPPSLEGVAQPSPVEPEPFFDFPENVPAAPPEDTEDFPLQPIIIKGGSGSSGGGAFFRIVMRLLLLGLALAGIGFLVIIGTYGWYARQRLYDDNSGGRPILVTVTSGEGFRSIVNGMQKEGLLGSFFGLDDRYLMRYLAYFYDNSDKIKPGVYRFSPGQNLDDVYRKLVDGSKDYKLTIPEGKTAHEVGELVAKHYTSFDPDYFEQLVNNPETAKSLGIDAPTLEGYLYPSTYYFGPGMKEEELLRLMVTTFKKKFETIQDKVTSDGMTLQDHVIMASLIEREARMDEDRPLIASVIHNRIAKGMPLQIDATVNYALGDWRRLKNTDYLIDHPYNTYKIKGLPPGPIASPRIESLLATYTAPQTSYLYYVHKGNGHHAFAETFAQHQANVGRYIRERNTAGAGNMAAAGAKDDSRSGGLINAADDTQPFGAADSAPTDDLASSSESGETPSEGKQPSLAPDGNPELPATSERSEEPITIRIESPVAPPAPAPTPAETPATPAKTPGQSATETPAPKSY